MVWEQLQKEALKARKEKDSQKANLLTTVISQVKNIAINEGHRAVSDQDVYKVVRQFLKSVEENLEYAREGKLTAEQKLQMEREKAILESFLPRQLTAEELREIIKNSGAKTIGDAMKYLKENHEGLFDGKLASQIARELLS
ncbi:MAG: GatB/YqeY domain-containing protein [Leptospiraceae bacterium]|nr:GatB/YqeY domain-containing protein [Leptospiraceae bacterium]MDW8305524.1 GatB/YqeY domain-containing protein [Leptospiraceae bacterium]